MMSHLFQAQVKPQILNSYHIRTIQLVSLSLSHAPLNHHHQQYARQSLLLHIPPLHPVPSLDITPIASSPHSHNEDLQEFTNLQPTLMIPQAISHELIRKILLEHCQLLHMIPFVDVTN
ncbi:hypothetical protein O181_006399 [Austropuccinia psidii MF-1]|uniref:Uncharacterized protein n=1 Tax=Austropuccinia psidii MF-1 TaxID=1389203 RepID=A0A9Q3BK09_9BASI|nr:hypothetical protein [Austropuccinia psidii MF-1]